MSSHREAPEIAKDPVADSTDVYAFVSPDRPDTVTLIANYIPFQAPDGGPNFYEFGDDVAYDINISNKGKGEADIIYRFRFHTEVRNPKTFLYNTGPIANIHDTTWNRPQFYSVTRIENGKSKVLAEQPALPAGQRRQAQHAELRRPRRPGRAQDRPPPGLRRAAGRRVPRRPRQHLRPRGAAAGPAPAPDPDGRRRRAQLAAGLQRALDRAPGADLGGQPRAATCRPTRRGRVGGRRLGSASRRKSRMFDKSEGAYVGHGPWEQVSRLGNPLFNEVITPMADKDAWNARRPKGDAAFAKYVQPPGAGPAAAGALPGRLPAPRGVPQAAGRPERRSC